MYLGVRNEQDSYPQGLTVHGGANQKTNKQIYKTSAYYYLLGGQLPFNKFWLYSYSVRGSARYQYITKYQWTTKNPAARELTPNSFLIQTSGSSCSLHLGPCPPELPKPGSFLTQVSAQGHLLREASLTAPTGGTISPSPFIVSTAKVFLFTYHYLIFLPSSVSSKRASRGLNRFALPLN